MHTTDELTINLAQAVALNRKPECFLGRLQKRVCCTFKLEQVGWDEFRLGLEGTEVGVKKARALVLNRIRPKQHDNTPQTFAHFNRLPAEIRQMIIDRVPCTQPEKQKSDGRGLLNLRLANRDLKFMAGRALKRERKCINEKLFLAEGQKSDQVRLGTPPYTSRIVVPMEELDQILGRTALTSTGEVHLRCEFREEWCDGVMKLLLKNSHIQPHRLVVYGVAGAPEVFHEYVAQTPSLKQLIFEKPLVKRAFFAKRFMPYVSKNFFNLGQQGTTPENIRSSYVNRHVYMREFTSQAAVAKIPYGQDKF